MRNSLKSKKMIQSLLHSGKRYSAPSLDLCRDAKMDCGVDEYRVAFLLSGKSGGAVARNRIKRWLRDDFHVLQKARSIPGCFAVKFRARADDVEHGQLRLELEKLLGAIN